MYINKNTEREFLTFNMDVCVSLYFYHCKRNKDCFLFTRQQPCVLDLETNHYPWSKVNILSISCLVCLRGNSPLWSRGDGALQSDVRNKGRSGGIFRTDVK